MIIKKSFLSLIAILCLAMTGFANPGAVSTSDEKCNENPDVYVVDIGENVSSCEYVVGNSEVMKPDRSDFIKNQEELNCIWEQQLQGQKAVKPDDGKVIKKVVAERKKVDSPNISATIPTGKINTTIELKDGYYFTDSDYTRIDFQTFTSSAFAPKVKSFIDEDGCQKFKFKEDYQITESHAVDDGKMIATSNAKEEDQSDLKNSSGANDRGHSNVDRSINPDDQITKSQANASIKFMFTKLYGSQGVQFDLRSQVDVPDLSLHTMKGNTIGVSTYSLMPEIVIDVTGKDARVLSGNTLSVAGDNWKTGHVIFKDSGNWNRNLTANVLRNQGQESISLGLR